MEGAISTSVEGTDVERLPSGGAVLGGRYRLGAVLGEGGMGIVWSAVRIDDGAEVAVKILKHGAEDARRRGRFVREARAAGAVLHPNVVRIHEVIDVDDVPLLVMELLRGESLAHRLARAGALSVRETATVLLGVVDAVGAAHARGLLHRDLKPANIFLAREDAGPTVVKVLDFGLAKWTAVDELDAAAAGMTTSGALLGTPCYMSPEQVFGERDIDHRTDVWSLGIIAYECLTGVLPTRGDNVGQVLKLVLTGRIPSLRGAAPDVPEALASLVDRMLSARREDRPSDLREVQRALAGYTDATSTAFGLPTRPSTSPVDRLEDAAANASRADPADTVDPGDEGAREAVPIRARRRARFAPAGAAIGVPVVVLALSAGWWARSGRDLPGPPAPQATSPAASVEPRTPAPTAEVPMRASPPSSKSETSGESSVDESVAPAPSSISSASAPKSAPSTHRKPAAGGWPAEFGP